MKNKIVIWSTDDQEKKFLLAIQLDEKENQVNIYKFPEAIVTEDFLKQMMGPWKNDEEVAFAEGYETISRQLSITEDLLPENLLVDRPDIITRAKAEWHFFVLSSKLYELYSSELADIKDRVDQMETYSSGIWEEMKGFWDKVQNQVREKNLFRNQANELRSTTNSLFDRLKEMRKELDNKFKEESKVQVAFFNEKIDEIKTKIHGGKSLQPLFEELKKLQSTFTKTKFAKDDRSKIWNKIDAAFKELKEKKYGKSGSQNSGNSALARLTSRYEGLISAIGRMKNSIDRDLRDKNSQSHQADRADGQLEAQLRQARIMMIDERISSKQVKMKDMLSTKEELEKKIEKEKQREERRKAEEERRVKTEAKKKEIKEKIAAETKLEVDESEAAKLEAAAAKIKEAKENAKRRKAEAPPIKSAEIKVEDVLTGTTVISTIVGESASEPAPEVKKESPADSAEIEINAEAPADEIKEVKSDPEAEKGEPELTESKAEAPPVDESAIKEDLETETIGEKVEDAVELVEDVIEDVVDAVKDIAETAMEKLEDFVEKLTDSEEE